MMTNDRLLFEVAAGLAEAIALTEGAWSAQAIRHAAAAQLVRGIQRALCAAQELERRAAGCPPAKEG